MFELFTTGINPDMLSHAGFKGGSSPRNISLKGRQKSLSDDNDDNNNNTATVYIN